MKKSLDALLSAVEYLPNRTPEMAFEGGAEGAFAEVSAYRDGSIYVGHYSGSSEWERHRMGDEIVMALEGQSTVVLWISISSRYGSDREQSTSPPAHPQYPAPRCRQARQLGCALAPTIECCRGRAWVDVSLRQRPTALGFVFADQFR